MFNTQKLANKIFMFNGLATFFMSFIDYNVWRMRTEQTIRVPDRRKLYACLISIEFKVTATACNEFFMRSPFDDSSLLHDQNLIRLADGA